MRAALAAWGGEAVARAPRGALRPVGEESLHVTLAFLGWRAEEDAPRIGALVAGCGAPCRGLSLGDALWLSPRRPHVLTVALEDADGALSALQRAVERVLARQAGFVPEARPFLPHVTVARVRRGQRVRPRDVELPPVPQMGFAAPALTLFRSHLSSAGARYRAVARAPLG